MKAGVSQPGTAPRTGAADILVAHHLARHYDSGPQRVDVLNGVNLRVRSGESVAVRGPSGCGKSTLLHLLGALDRPSSGTIWIDGRKLAGLSDDALADLRSLRIGFVFQAHHLLPQLTAMENVLLPALARGPAGAALCDRASRLLSEVGLQARLNHRPAELSGGERQRVAVVRALIVRPGVLLADEPTGSLDRDAAAGLADMLVALSRSEGTALVVVTHSPEVAARMETRYDLRHGKLVREDDAQQRTAAGKETV